MTHYASPPPSPSCSLKAGEQVVINGALVTVQSDCTLSVCPSASVFTGRALSAGRVNDPHIELYLSLSQVADNEERFSEERLRLFGLLSQIALENREAEVEDELRRCTLALLGGKRIDALLSAGALAASQTMESEDVRPEPLRPSRKPAEPIACAAWDGWREAS